ncbi:MAG: helix-turn-helix domain-containing protein [Acidimicrobiia bacterium]
MIHRHLAYPADLVPEDLPAAALVDLLDRGDLEDWRPIATAIARRPHGRVAEQVARLIDAFPMYGTSPLWRSFIERCRAGLEAPSAQPEQLGLSDLRRRRGFTQTDLAERIGISQSDLSKLERRRDWRLSTLLRYLAALDGRLRLMADFSDGPVELVWAESAEDPTAPT